MTCATVRELASGLIDGELDSNQAGVVRDHLAACPACAEYVESLADLSGLFAAGAGVTVPPGLWDGVRDRVAADAAPVTVRSGTTVRPFRSGARKWAAVAAAVLIVIALPVGLIVFRTAPATPGHAVDRHATPDGLEYAAPNGLALAAYVREIQHGDDEPREFLAMHDGREVALSELPDHLDFQPKFPSCLPAGVTMNKCYLLRTADGTAVGCVYRNGSRQIMVFQQRAGEPVLCDGLEEAQADQCESRCKSMVSGNVTVLNWEGDGRVTTVVYRDIEAAEIDGFVDSMIAEGE